MFILLQDSAHHREAKSRDTQTHTAGYGKVGSYIIINREKNFILQNYDFSFFMPLLDNNSGEMTNLTKSGNNSHQKRFGPKTKRVR